MESVDVIVLWSYLKIDKADVIICVNSIIMA